MNSEQSIRLRRRGSTSFDPSPQDIDTMAANGSAPTYESATSPQSDSVSPHLGRSQPPWTGSGEGRKHHIYFSPHFPSDKSWMARYGPPPSGVIDHTVHCGDGIPNNQSINTFVCTIENGLGKYLEDLRSSAYLSRDRWGDASERHSNATMSIELTPKIQNEMNEYAQMVADASTGSFFLDCKGLAVSPNSLERFNEIRDTCRNEGTKGCLVYSNAIKTRRSSRGSIFPGWTSSTAEEKKWTMRCYIDHSRQVDTQATHESLRQVAEKLKELSESTTIRSNDIHGPLKGFAIPREVSTYAVEQGVLDELKSSDPVVLTNSVDSGVFTRRPTY
ncbi:hypothetical protein L486_03806 [Kwoniella mangroviensis CBS 10435]|uniref:Uncharacterized protein n=1 Tax=Kwoniella mangroviensis CBS 10435 TaxID=1331196 RepID=A0A1B9IUX3_9TREE|nr:hypothetical protein L486_03806 [Kwoniella mangroviensis CBS 10435]